MIQSEKWKMHIYSYSNIYVVREQDKYSAHPDVIYIYRNNFASIIWIKYTCVNYIYKLIIIIKKLLQILLY